MAHFCTSIRGAVAAATLLGLLLLLPRAAGAYDASVGWQPTTGAAGYTLYVRYGATGTPQPTNVGRPSPDADGLLRVLIDAVPLGPTAYFSVAAYDANGTAGAVSQQLSITYAQAAVVSDSDADGLTDAQEDVDLDRTVDAGETNPGKIDSDGDGYSDGNEVLVYGTDPLDAKSFPQSSTTTTTTTTLAPPPPPPSTTTTTLPPQCSTASNCNDSNPCTTDSCVLGKCAHAAASTGSCDDGDPCTVGDACSAGTCAGWVLDCSHLDGPCTYGVCDPGIAECTTSQVTSGTTCSDGSACTTGDVCNAGVCSGVNACASGTFCEAASKTCKVRAEIWVAAARDETATFSGAMTDGTAYTGGADADTAADSIESSLVFAASTTNDMKATGGDIVRYAVDLPAAGRWYAWGRFYYPGAPGSNDANSFFLRIDAGTALRFGNNKSYFRRWHWDGDGRYESGTPVALPLGQLTAGPHTLTIAKREVTPIAPRLDVIVLTQDPAWLPTDAAARAALPQ